MTLYKTYDKFQQSQYVILESPSILLTWKAIQRSVIVLKKNIYT